MVKEMQIAPRMMSRILHDDLGLRAVQTLHETFINCKIKRNQMRESPGIVELYGSGAYNDILVTDEKIFDIEAAFNKQNDCVYARYGRSSVKDREKVPCVQHRHYPAHMMVWLGVNW